MQSIPYGVYKDAIRNPDSLERFCKLKEPPYAYAAGLAVVNQSLDRILLLKRTWGSHPNTWAPPGGRRKDHERYGLQTALREFITETGILPEGELQLPSVVTIREDSCLTFLTYLLQVPDTSVETIRPKLNHENHAWGWFSYEEAQQSTMHPEAVHILEKLNPKRSPKTAGVTSFFQNSLRRIGTLRERVRLATPTPSVPVYHETQEAFLQGILHHGLLRNGIKGHFDSYHHIRNRIEEVEKAKPGRATELGITSLHTTAYPSLSHGHGLTQFTTSAAAMRYVSRSEKQLEETFSRLTGINKGCRIFDLPDRPEDYIAQWHSEEFLLSRFPGAVIELKVDPTRCFVADLFHFLGGRHYYLIGPDGMAIAEKESASHYWDTLITLQEFLAHYDPAPDPQQKLENHIFNYQPGMFTRRKDAPTHLPAAFKFPEVLLTYDVPPECIEVLPPILPVI